MDVLPFKLGFVKMFIVSCMTHFIPIYSMVISCIFFFWTDTHKSTSRKKTWLTSVIFFVWSDPLTPRKSPWNPSKWVLRDPPPSAWRLKPKSTRPKMTSAASRKLVHSWYAMGPWYIYRIHKKRHNRNAQLCTHVILHRKRVNYVYGVNIYVCNCMYIYIYIYR